ncbi:1-phosphatidylinositol phosphodiesterase precursor [compost metagenome]
MNSTARNNRHTSWMQSIYNTIKHLKLHELALPSAHNSGMDKGVAEPIGRHWAVCQDHIFSVQMNHGARVLDLRIVDNSYKKDVGGSKVPRYRFVEKITCQHGIQGRSLDRCVSSVRTFAEANRGEIIILDIHSYSPGRNLNNAIQRCKNKLSTLANLLIPPTASALTLEEIRQTYPGKNVIICWSQGGYWPTIQHRWSGNNITSESQLMAFIQRSRNESAKGALNSLSATAYTVANGPVRIKNGNSIWDEVFSPLQQSFNIINADFLQDTGVVERCIALNNARGSKKF